MNLDRNGKDWATVRFTNSKTKAGYNNFYQFKVSKPNHVMIGSFYGANAVEVGGEFSIYRYRIATAEPIEAADGVFRAKKQ